MRKIVVIFLTLAMVTVLFAACGGNEEDTTTTAPIATGNVSTTQPTTTQAQPVSYILTTSPSKTVPWMDTTRFDASSVTTDYNVVIPSDVVSAPDVNISSTGSSLPATTTTTTNQSQSTSWFSTTTTTATTTTKPTTTKPTTTKAPEKFATALVIDSEAYDSNSGKLYLSISPSSWSSDIKANSTSIPIRIDGVEADGKVTCSVTAGKNADGMQEIIIDLSGQSVSAGSTVSFTIPSSFLVSKAGTQYNSAYSSSVSF